VRLQQIGEVVRQLLGAQIVDPVLEVSRNAAYAPCVRLDRLRTEALEMQVLFQSGVTALEIGLERC
jgi:hypothetical protein